MRSGRRLVSSGYTSCHELTDFSYDSMIRLCTVGDLSPICPRQLLYGNHVSGKHTGNIWRKEISGEKKSMEKGNQWRKEINGEKKSMEKRIGCFFLFICLFVVFSPRNRSAQVKYFFICCNVHLCSCSFMSLARQKANFSAQI